MYRLSLRGMLEQLRQPERAPARRRVPAPLRHFAAMTDYCRVSSGGPEHHWAQEVQRRDPASVARAAAAKRQLWRSVPSGQRFKKRVSQRDASDVKGIREKGCHLPQKIEFNYLMTARIPSIAQPCYLYISGQCTRIRRSPTALFVFSGLLGVSKFRSSKR